MGLEKLITPATEESGPLPLSTTHVLILTVKTPLVDLQPLFKRGEGVWLDWHFFTFLQSNPQFSHSTKDVLAAYHRYQKEHL